MPNKTDCKHLNTRIMGNEPVMKATCPECHETVYISEVLNNWLDELNAAYGGQQACTYQMEAILRRMNELVKNLERRFKDDPP